jgi:hypothetical protein
MKDKTSFDESDPKSREGSPVIDEKRSSCWDDEKSDDSWWEDRSLPVKILMGIGFAILGLGLLALFGWVVMLLWNWLMPDIFGLKTITYFQAWGLLALSFILFKGIGGSSGSNSSDKKRKRHLRRYVKEAYSESKRES